MGASLLVAGVDGLESSVKLAICETEPSGAVSISNPYWSSLPAIVEVRIKMVLYHQDNSSDVHLL